VSHTLALIIESLVAILLMITIWYCVSLNKRLIRLRADEHALKATISELITATEIAERAIGGLKLAVRDVNENLGNQMGAATQMSEQLKRQLMEGDHVVRRLSRIASAARPLSAALEAEPEPAPIVVSTPAPKPAPAPAPVTGARAVAAAAQAFSERRRSGGLAA
jgi:hypothetical protein